MIKAFQKNWRVYLIEAWALGMFMVSACAFVILFEHPYFGLPMGITVVLLIYSKWDKQSGSHMNPVVTLANYHLDRMVLPDTIWYIFAQFTGYFAEALVFFFIVFEAPLSGMSINPARSFGSALPANN